MPTFKLIYYNETFQPKESCSRSTRYRFSHYGNVWSRDLYPPLDMHLNASENPITKEAPSFSKAIKIIENPVYAPKAASSDSVDITVNVTYAKTGEKGELVFFFPSNETETPYGITGSQKEYVYRTTKGEYDIIFWGDKSNDDGNMFYYSGKVNIQKDTVLNINTADINLETPILTVMPNGEPVQQDLYVTSTKEVADTGNVHTGTQVFFGFEYVPRKMHVTHVTYFISYQKTKPETVGAALDSRKNPFVWVNRKDLPFHIMQLHKYISPIGILGVRYDMNPGEYGDTLRNTKESWEKYDLNYAVKQESTPDFNPKSVAGNGMLIWFNGDQCNSSLGFVEADTLDVKNRYWMSGPYNNTEEGYDCALFPGLAMSKVGSTTYSYCPTPITLTKNGIEPMAFQYLYPGLNIWAGCDGYGVRVNKTTNKRINPDKDVVWGEGLAFVSIYPNYNNKAATPNYRIGPKGIYGEQRSMDIPISELRIDTLDNGKWNRFSVTTGDKITTVSTVLRGAKYSGKVGLEVCDTNYFIGNTRGQSISRVEFDMKNTKDFTAPVINMINFRTEEDKIANSFEYLNNATLEFYAADLEGWIKSYMGFIMHEVTGASARFRLHGTEEWMDLPLSANKEYDEMIFLGQNYSGKFANIMKEAKAGTYDVEITVHDAADNKGIVTACPAFLVEKDGYANSVSEIVTEDGNSIILNGTEVSCPDDAEADITIYDVTGKVVAAGIGHVDISSVEKGIIIVKATGNNFSAVKKFRL